MNFNVCLRCQGKIKYRFRATDRTSGEPPIQPNASFTGAANSSVSTPRPQGYEAANSFHLGRVPAEKLTEPQCLGQRFLFNAN